MLYKYETDLAELIQTEFDGDLQTGNGQSEESAAWLNQAEQRKKIMNELMWDKKREKYYDYNFIQKKKTNFQSLTIIPFGRV